MHEALEEEIGPFRRTLQKEKPRTTQISRIDWQAGSRAHGAEGREQGDSGSKHTARRSWPYCTTPSAPICAVRGPSSLMAPALTLPILTTDMNIVTCCEATTCVDRGTRPAYPPNETAVGGKLHQRRYDTWRCSGRHGGACLLLCADGIDQRHRAAHDARRCPSVPATFLASRRSEMSTLADGIDQMELHDTSRCLMRACDFPCTPTERDEYVAADGTTERACYYVRTASTPEHDDAPHSGTRRSGCHATSKCRYRKPLCRGAFDFRHCTSRAPPLENREGGAHLAKIHLSFVRAAPLGRLNQFPYNKRRKKGTKYHETSR